MRTKLLILSIIVAAGFSFAADAVLFGNMLETDWILTPEGVTNAILATASTVESDPLAYPVATNALALAEGAVEHAESAHGLTDNGGFAGGSGASATYGGAVGNSASATYGGAVGNSASATYGGSVGNNATATYGGAVGSFATATDGGAVGRGADATYGGAVGNYAYATYGGAVGNYAMTSSGFAGGFQARAALDDTGSGTPIDAIQLGTGWNPDANTFQVYSYKLMNADGSIPAERMATTLSGYATTGAVAAVQAEVAGKADAETVVSGAVGTASAGNRYFWTSATNVVLSVDLAPGQVVNLARLNNTGAASITATGQAGWEWTGGDATNTIPAGKSMTFGFLIDAATGKTNAYATGVSK